MGRIDDSTEHLLEGLGSRLSHWLFFKLLTVYRDDQVDIHIAWGSPEYCNVYMYLRICTLPNLGTSPCHSAPTALNQ